MIVKAIVKARTQTNGHNAIFLESRTDGHLCLCPLIILMTVHEGKHTPEYGVQGGILANLNGSQCD